MAQAAAAAAWGGGFSHVSSSRGDVLHSTTLLVIHRQTRSHELRGQVRTDRQAGSNSGSSKPKRMSSTLSGLLGAASAVGRRASAAAAALASTVRGGGMGSLGTVAGGGAHRAGAGVQAAERQIDEVVHILSPGPLASSATPPSESEMRDAEEAVRAAKSAWRERRRAQGR